MNTDFTTQKNSVISVYPVFLWTEINWFYLLISLTSSFNMIVVNMASLSTKEKWLEEFNSKEGPKTFKFLADGKILFCKVCEKAYENVFKKSQIGQHVGSKTHEKNCQLKGGKKVTQAQLEDCFTTKPKKSRAGVVEKELCEAFFAACIPWMKLDVPKFRRFLESNIGISMPDRTTLEKKYLGEFEKGQILRKVFT